MAKTKAAKPDALDELLARKATPKRDWEANLPPVAAARFADIRRRWQARPRQINAKREEIWQSFCKVYGDVCGDSAFYQSLARKS